MNQRSAFLATIPIARELVAASADRWEEPSALDGMTIGDLAAHTARAASTVAGYLDDDHGAGEPTVDAPGYYVAIDGISDPTSATNAGVRQRAAEEAAAGPRAVLQQLDTNVFDLTLRLRAVPRGHTVEVFGGQVMTLDEYLVTRLVELVIHCDDLAVSLDRHAPEFPSETTDVVVATLVAIARRRHSDNAVLRALTRRERDEVEALRVL